MDGGKQPVSTSGVVYSLSLSLCLQQLPAFSTSDGSTLFADDICFHAQVKSMPFVSLHSRWLFCSSILSLLGEWVAEGIWSEMREWDSRVQVSWNQCLKPFGFIALIWPIVDSNSAEAVPFDFALPYFNLIQLWAELHVIGLFIIRIKCKFTEVFCVVIMLQL